MPARRFLGLAVVACLVAPAACGGDATPAGDGGADGTGGAAGLSLVGAPGVTVTQVAIYQGVKRVLAVAGAEQSSEVPLVAGRPALVRVFYTADVGMSGKPVTGRLQLEGQPDLLVDAKLGSISTDGALTSTINFELDGSQIGSTFRYAVSVLADASADNPAAHHPAPGTFESHVVEGAPNTFRVVLVPFRYDADGSGRLPDTSPEAVELYQNRLLQLFPVSDVEVTVRAPVPWSNPIGPYGEGWQDVMQETYALRITDGVSPDVYYYSIFNPLPTFGQFCQQGCLLGVTGLNDEPADVGEPDLRWAVGVGYPQTSFDTCAHELGHSHGRRHVDCGNGVDPDSIDQGYPHSPETIGTWGWDPIDGQLVEPTSHTDIMGYCDSQWISDYNYRRLFDRATNVNLASYHGPPITYDVLMWDGNEATWATPVTRARPFMSAPTPVTARGLAPQDLEGHFVPYDHLPGGMWFIPRASDDGARRGRSSPRPNVYVRPHARR